MQTQLCTLVIISVDKLIIEDYFRNYVHTHFLIYNYFMLYILENYVLFTIILNHLYTQNSFIYSITSIERDYKYDDNIMTSKLL